MFKTCTNCNTEHPIDNFHKNKLTSDGRHHWCKPCKGLWYKNLDDPTSYNRKSYKRRNKTLHQSFMRLWRHNNPQKLHAYQIKHNKRLRQATPSWCNHEDIITIYSKCKEFSIKWGLKLQVDHILPIAGKLVSGLNVPANLQLLDQPINASKSNKYPWTYEED